MLRSLWIFVALGLCIPGTLGNRQLPQAEKTAIEKMPTPPPPFVVRNRQGGATIEVSFRWVQQNDEHEQLRCAKRCRGTHRTPFECEKGDCDDPCSGDHHEYFDAEVDYPEGDFRALGRTLEQLDRSGKKAGIETLPTFQLLKIADVQLDEDTVADAYDLEVDWAHWCNTPCSQQVRVFKWAVFRLVTQITPKNGVLAGDPVDIEGAILYIPTGEYEDQKATLSCGCASIEAFPMPKPSYKTSYLPTGSEPIDYRTGQITVIKEGMEYALGPSQLPGYQIEAKVKSMNEIEWSATNTTSMPVEVCIYPGVTLESKDPAVQNIVATTGVKLLLPAAMSGPYSEKVTAVGRGMCLNMHKGQPSGSTDYRVVPAGPDATLNLSRLYDREPIKTVEGQIRMWIVTDHATLPEIQKYLIFPKPSPAQYLHSLYAVATRGGVNLRKSAFAKCLDPNLVGGAPSSASQVRWFVNLMEKVNAKGLATAARNTANFEGLWSPSASRYQVKYVCDLVDALARSTDPDVAASAVDVLLAVPDPLREKVDAEGGLIPVSNWLRKKDATRAEAALRVIEAYKSKMSEIPLANVHPELPDAVKAKAAELLKTLQ